MVECIFMCVPLLAFAECFLKSYLSLKKCFKHLYNYFIMCNMTTENLGALSESGLGGGPRNTR